VLLDVLHIRLWQNGAPPHSGRQLTAFYSRQGPIASSSRSPDLTAMDYFLWGRMKSCTRP
jgi:hypothetical protein